MCSEPFREAVPGKPSDLSLVAETNGIHQGQILVKPSSFRTRRARS